MIFCIDAGHGGTDFGATFSGTRESDIALAIMLHVADRLWGLEHEVVMTRPNGQAVSLNKRVKIANAAGAGAFISIHANADPDPDAPGEHEARGLEVWINQGSVRGRTLADAIRSSMVASLPDEPDRGVKESDRLYVLKHTTMPAALVEVGFLDDRATLERLRDPVYRKLVGTAIANGVDAWAKGG
jgi:N-acetylmuramoyl-L-alanine amidase